LYSDIARLAPRGAALLLTLILAACGGGGGSNNNSGGGGSSTESTVVNVTVANAALSVGGSTTLTAALTGPGAASGVSWTLSGSGTLTGATTTTVTYNAPATLTGGESVLIAATAVAAPTVGATAQIQVNGTPVILTPAVYPLYQNAAASVGYAVSGGTAPYTWAISAGSLPTGLTLGTSTTNSNTIGGTPTATGTSNYTIAATDSLGRTVSANTTLEVRQQTACLLQGNYAFLLAGFRGEGFVARGGSLTVAADGKITGVEDLADVSSTSTGSNLSSGTCRTQTQNFGSSETTSPALQATHSYAVINNLSVAHFHQADNTGIRGSGELTIRPTAVSAAPTGSFAFGLYGVDSSGAAQAVIGRATLDAGGAITAGRVDVAGAGAASAAALTGSFGAPGDAGRGTATLSFGGRSLTVYFYPVGPNKFYALSGAASAPRLAGFITRQTGVGTTPATALASAGILSAWGNPQGAEAVTALGRLSLSGANTANLVLDTARKGDSPRTDTFSAMPLAVDADGRATLASADNSRRFVIYFDGVANGYAVETTGVAKFGLLERQSGAPFPASQGGTFVSSTQYGNRTTTLLLAPNVQIGSGFISGPLTGTYTLETATGRGAGTTSVDYYGGTGITLYLIDSNRIRIMGNAQRGLTPVGSAISVLQN
jgi:hypothetical protein